MFVKIWLLHSVLNITCSNFNIDILLGTFDEENKKLNEPIDDIDRMALSFIMKIFENVSQIDIKNDDHSNKKYFYSTDKNNFYLFEQKKPSEYKKSTETHNEILKTIHQKEVIIIEQKTVYKLEDLLKLNEINGMNNIDNNTEDNFNYFIYLSDGSTNHKIHSICSFIVKTHQFCLDLLKFNQSKNDLNLESQNFLKKIIKSICHNAFVQKINSHTESLYKHFLKNKNNQYLQLENEIEQAECLFTRINEVSILSIFQEFHSFYSQKYLNDWDDQITKCFEEKLLFEKKPNEFYIFKIIYAINKIHKTEKKNCCIYDLRTPYSNPNSFTSFLQIISEKKIYAQKNVNLNIIADWNIHRIIFNLADNFYIAFNFFIENELFYITNQKNLIPNVAILLKKTLKLDNLRQNIHEIICVYQKNIKIHFQLVFIDILKTKIKLNEFIKNNLKSILHSKKELYDLILNIANLYQKLFIEEIINFFKNYDEDCISFKGLISEFRDFKLISDFRLGIDYIKSAENKIKAVYKIENSHEEYNKMIVDLSRNIYDICLQEKKAKSETDKNDFNSKLKDRIEKKDDLFQLDKNDTEENFISGNKTNQAKRKNKRSACINPTRPVLPKKQPIEEKPIQSEKEIIFRSEIDEKTFDRSRKKIEKSIRDTEKQPIDKKTSNEKINSAALQHVKSELNKDNFYFSGTQESETEENAEIFSGVISKKRKKRSKLSSNNKDDNSKLPIISEKIYEKTLTNDALGIKLYKDELELNKTFLQKTDMPSSVLSIDVQVNCNKKLLSDNNFSYYEKNPIHSEMEIINLKKSYENFLLNFLIIIEKNYIEKINKFLNINIFVAEFAIMINDIKFMVDVTNLFNFNFINGSEYLQKIKSTEKIFYFIEKLNCVTIMINNLKEQITLDIANIYLVYFDLIIDLKISLHYYIFEKSKIDAIEPISNITHYTDLLEITTCNSEIINTEFIDISNQIKLFEDANHNIEPFVVGQKQDSENKGLENNYNNEYCIAQTCLLNQISHENIYFNEIKNLYYCLKNISQNLLDLLKKENENIDFIDFSQLSFQSYIDQDNCDDKLNSVGNTIIEYAKLIQTGLNQILNSNYKNYIHDENLMKYAQTIQIKLIYMLTKLNLFENHTNVDSELIYQIENLILPYDLDGDHTNQTIMYFSHNEEKIETVQPENIVNYSLISNQNCDPINFINDHENSFAISLNNCEVLQEMNPMISYNWLKISVNGNEVIIYELCNFLGIPRLLISANPIEYSFLLETVPNNNFDQIIFIKYIKKDFSSLNYTDAIQNRSRLNIKYQDFDCLHNDFISSEKYIKIIESQGKLGIISNRIQLLTENKPYITEYAITYNNNNFVCKGENFTFNFENKIFVYELIDFEGISEICLETNPENSHFLFKMAYMKLFEPIIYVQRLPKHITNHILKDQYIETNDLITFLQYDFEDTKE
ncbi:hypothetical protein GVAV_000500 [Gurleya vavrai]